MSDEDLSVELTGHVATVEIQRPPDNYFDLGLVEGLADLYEDLDTQADCRAIVLCSQGKHFCAGADFQAQSELGPTSRGRVGSLYRSAVRLFRTAKPVVAAVQGAAVGGGLGLALSTDFRITCEEARFCANFSRLGFHQGFGLSVTLPRLVGHARADLMLYTGRRINGDEAVRIGLADELVPREEVRAKAMELALEIAGSAPLAVQSIRRTRREGLADAVEAATERELIEQTWLRETADFEEGVRAMRERRPPDFKGR